MVKFHCSGLAGLAALVFGCSAAPGDGQAGLDTAGAQSQMPTGPAAAGSATQANVAGSAGSAGAPLGALTTGGAGGTDNPSAGASGLLGGASALPEGGTGGSLAGSPASAGMGGARSSAGGGAGASGAGAAGAAGVAGAEPVPPVDPLAPYTGCNPGFTYYLVPNGTCIVVKGDFIGGSAQMGCDYRYMLGALQTCATLTATLGDQEVMFQVGPGRDPGDIKVTRFQGNGCVQYCARH